MNKQQTGVVLVEDELSVQGQRVRTQTESFWTYYPGNVGVACKKSTNETQQQIIIPRENKLSTNNSHKNSIRMDGKQISYENNDNFSTRWQNQASNTLYRVAKSARKEHPLVTTSFATLTEPYRSTTAPLIFEDNLGQTLSTRIKSTTPFRTSCLTDSSFFQFEPTRFQTNNHYVDTNNHMDDTLNTNSFLDLSIDTNLPNDENESKLLHHHNQCKINGFQHIANLGSWQRNSKKKQIELSAKSKELDGEDELSKDIDQLTLNSSNKISDYKSPFSDEYNQAICLQGQFQTNNNMNEWNLKDFYRDVKTNFDPETNTKPVFEKCLKLARLQSNTIKWEQRRRQNLNIYNRLMKTATLDNNIFNINGNFTLRNNNDRDIRDINELRRELRCNECRRVACLGNCAPGQEYHQYKRFIPYSSLPTTRDQIRCKLNLRTQRSTTDLRPRSQQQIIRETKFKFDQTNLTPVVDIPLFSDEIQTKRSHKKLTNGYLPSKSFRSQRREALTLISSHKILS